MVNEVIRDKVGNLIINIKGHSITQKKEFSCECEPN